MFHPDTTVLVIDDNRTSRELIKRQLGNFGLKNYLEAEDGLKAVSQLERAISEKIQVGLIICDWNMPNMSGIEFLQTIKKRPEFKRIPFLMATAVSSSPEILEAIKLGANDYVTKPIDENLLRAKLAAVFKKTLK